MIGCERLCGKCEACGSLAWALSFDRPELYIGEFVIGPEKELALSAVAGPSSLVDLLARALKGRSVDATAEHKRMSIGDLVTIDRLANGRRVELLKSWFASNLAPIRSALSRLLALPLNCGANVAIAALEE